MSADYLWGVGMTYLAIVLGITISYVFRRFFYDLP